MFFKKYTIVLYILIYCIPGYSQYSPAGGKPGSDAIYKDSSVFKEWASGCTVKRGYIQINDTSLTDTEESITSNKAFFGIPDNAIGPPEGALHVVSLGDAGSAIVTFNKPVTDGEGPDFAVFENGFAEPAPPYEYFLELGFVEVSTDGKRYVRFPSVSLTQTDTQVGTFGQLDPTKIYNLAGKYTADYGTPFDLHELADSSGIDINNINYVRITDVVGSIDPRYGSYDSQGHIVNDPFPTPFWSCGFDLQAVGVINEIGESNGLKDVTANNLTIYPNPLKTGNPFFISPSDNPDEIINLQITNISGKVVFESTAPFNQTGYTTNLPEGLYIVTVQTNGNYLRDKLVILK
jgi:hypothetical protein